MSIQPKEGEATRRDFLKVAAVAAPAAAAATLTAPGAAEASVADAGDCMQDTAHTRAYLASARF
ncbi:MAG: ubiquinol-cytochrome c reductase iron-sulfur subunit N-terminal domain-containing protein [Pseudomonadota bacterium]